MIFQDFTCSNILLKSFSHLLFDTWAWFAFSDVSELRGHDLIRLEIKGIMDDCITETITRELIFCVIELKQLRRGNFMLVN